MKRFFSFELAIVIVSILMYWIIGTASIKVKSLGDLDFHLEAVRIAHCLQNGESCQSVSLNKAPLPSVFYAIPYAFLPFGSSDNSYWNAAIGWSALFITLALLLVYRAANNIFRDKRAGIIFIIFSFIIPLHIYYGLGVLAEGPAYIAVSISIYGWSILEQNRRKGIVYFALGIIALILARPNAILVLPLLFVTSGFFWWTKRGGVKTQRYITIAAVIMGAAVLIIFSAVKKLPGNKSDSQESYFLHVAQHGRYQFRDETWDWRFWDDNVRANSKDYQNSGIKKAELDSLVQVEGSYEKVYTQWLIEDLVSNPGKSLKQFFVRIIYGHTLTVNSITKDSFSLGPLQGPFGYYVLIGGLNLLNWTMILFSVYSLYFLRKRWTEVWPMLMPWLALVLFSASIYMEQRYLFPIRPLIILLASGGMLNFYEGLRLRFFPDTQN